jgi:hypothetical protein
MGIPVRREEPRGSTVREEEIIPTTREEVGCSDLGEKAKTEAGSSSRGLAVVTDDLPAVQVEHTILMR